MTLYILLYKNIIYNFTGCPQVLRTDAGTENCLLAMIQPMLRHEHNDPFSNERSHIYGRSTSNQVSVYKFILLTPCILHTLQIVRELRPGGLNCVSAIQNGG